MSYYDPQSWQVPIKRPSWEHDQLASRPESSSAALRDDMSVFHTQVEEVDRALDNLANSGKFFNAPSRRDSVPMAGGPPAFADLASRMPQRHSVGDYDQMRTKSNLQSFYANQRHQSRPNEAEQMMQAKRRMAAQRERELRNYHQEQQYSRNAATDMSAQGKSDRAISPNTMNEEDRRELIARQHRALYGTDAASFDVGGEYGEERHTPRPGKPVSGNSSATFGRGASPLTYDGFVMGQNQTTAQPSETGSQYVHNDTKQQPLKGPPSNAQQQRSRADSTSSPASNPPSQTFSLLDSTAQQSSRTSTSSPGGSPPRQAKTAAPGHAPIGTRPNPSQPANPALSKQSSTPSPSPLGFGFAPNDNLPAIVSGNERSTSAASNPSGGARDGNVSSWNTNNGGWGNKTLGVQASVWG